MYSVTKKDVEGRQLGKEESLYTCYGLMGANGDGVVPHCHTTPEEAVGELIYYLRMNEKQLGNRKFLAEDYTPEQIDAIEKDLLEQAKAFGNNQLSLF